MSLGYYIMAWKVMENILYNRDGNDDIKIIIITKQK